jgi:hypothetical protein
MGSPVAVGTAVVTGLAGVGMVLLLAPDGSRAERSAAPVAPDPLDTARTFWDHAEAGECREASELMWWPADRARRQQAYAEVCADAAPVTGVDLGEASPVAVNERPYGASDMVSVPVTLTDASGTTALDLDLVAVDDRWYVIR